MDEEISEIDIAKSFARNLKEMKEADLLTKNTSFEDVCNYAGSHVLLSPEKDPGSPGSN